MRRMPSGAHAFPNLPVRPWVQALRRFDSEFGQWRKIAVLLHDPWLYAKASIVLAYVGIFVAVYLPVIVTSYGFLDDYSVLEQSLRGRMADFIHLSAIYGRPLYAFLMPLAIHPIKSVAGLSALRAVGILNIALLALVFHVHLCRARLPPAVSLALPVALGLMPPFQVYASWGIAALFPLAGVLGGLAFTILEWSPVNARSKLGFRALAAIVLLTAALSIYQPAAMVFWVFAAVTLIGRDSSLESRMLGVAATVMIAALGVDFVLAKLLPYLLWQAGAGLARTALVKDIGDKSLWFASEPLRDALNLVFIRPSTVFAVCVALFAAGGLWLYWSGPIRARVERLAVALALVPATYLPNLLVAENWASYRTQVGLTSLLLVYATLGCVGWLRALRKTPWLPAVMAGVVGVSALAANKNVMLYFAMPQHAEYTLFDRAMTELGNSSMPKITGLDFYVANRWSLTDFARYDEFGLLSNSAAWVPPALAWLILSSHGSSLANDPMQVLHRGELPAAPGNHLIDLDVVMFGSVK